MRPAAGRKITRRVRVALGERLRPVGELVFETDGRRETSVFRYSGEWIADPAAFALAPGMPLSGSPFYAAASGSDRRSALLGPFRDGAPEAWGRGLIRRALPGPLTEPDYLLAADDETRQGALRYLDEAGTPLARSRAPPPGREQLAELRRLTGDDRDLTPQQWQRWLGSASVSGRGGHARPCPGCGRVWTPRRPAPPSATPTGRSRSSSDSIARRPTASTLLARMVSTVTDEWRARLRAAGLSSPEVAACEPAFEHQQTRIARGLSHSL